MLLIREATTKDTNQILDLYKAAMQELVPLGGYPVEDDPSAWISSHRIIREMIRDESSAVFVAVDGRKVVGYEIASVYTLEPPFSPLRIVRSISTYLIPEFRGGSTAKRLVERALAWGKECGAQLAEADTLVDNRSTLLLQRGGFVVNSYVLRKAL